jgi:hypothetical protein
MTGDKEIAAALDAIDRGVIDFNEALPKIEAQIYRKLLEFQKELSVQGETITNSASNIRKLSKLKAELEHILLYDSDYSEAVAKFVKLYEKVDQLNFNYYKALEKKFTPPKIIEAVRKQTISITLDNLTESGLNANLINPLRDIIQTYVTTGGSYAAMTEELRTFIKGSDKIEPALTKYAKTYVTDSINQYVGNVNAIITADLGFDWFRYAGSNIKTTRTFCKALTQKKFFHKSELPAIIRGQFDEFKRMKGQINQRTELPQGMYDDTNAFNFASYRGGYNCGHQVYGVSEKLVPADVQNRITV